ncbi:Tyrosinase central domain-containing protein [Mycena kentingensis (nom. inval.)]|nr:Tyrosinase central domain-containing protein [Mycena kentingensis (nom. inval.)]
MENGIVKPLKSAPTRRVHQQDIPAWMLFLTSVVLVLLSSVLALLALLAFFALHQRPHSNTFVAFESNQCAHPLVRREWRTLADSEKLDYIAAVQCLQRKPGITGIHGAKTRFEDFQAVHIVLSEAVHLVGHFLPWHRRLLHAYETALRTECAFEGTFPYWDWSEDIDSGLPIAKSPVFDPVFGLGGNGVDIPNYNGQFGNLTRLESFGWVAPGAGGGCVTDGPFAEYQLNTGPGTNITKHCLQRAFNENIRGFLTGEQVQAVLEEQSFESFRIRLEGAPVYPTMGLHDAGHNLVGGEMADRYSSPGDPVFYLHHAFLDKIWWDWVQMDSASRITDVSGRSTVEPPFTDITLDFELDMLGLVPTVTVREVMDLDSESLCYTYE